MWLRCKKKKTKQQEIKKYVKNHDIQLRCTNFREGSCFCKKLHFQESSKCENHLKV